MVICDQWWLGIFKLWAKHMPQGGQYSRITMRSLVWRLGWNWEKIKKRILLHRWLTAPILLAEYL